MSTTSTSSSAKLRRDTGFPEPFCGNRNTTRPHPEANLSPDATLSADDIDPARSLHRSRRSILRRSKHKGSLKYGKLAAEPLQRPSTSSSSPSLGATSAGDPRESAEVATPDALDEVKVVMLPDGEISSGGMLSFDEERRAAEEEHKKKRNVFKKILGHAK